LERGGPKGTLLASAVGEGALGVVAAVRIAFKKSSRKR
jgi:hypothetical protein